MSRMIIKFISSFNKNHFIMILVLVTLFFMFPIDTSARRRDYKTFDWESFYSDNMKYWSDYCENDENAEQCRNDIIYYQQAFYTKLYNILAKYQEDDFYISDYVLVMTAFFELIPSYTGNPVMVDRYKYNYSPVGDVADRSAIKVDPDDINPEINDDYTTTDEEKINSMANYYDKETDTIYTLAKSAIGYTTYCYGSYGPPKEVEVDGVKQKYCEEGSLLKLHTHTHGSPTDVEEKCVDNISAGATNDGYTLGFWTYFTSRLENDSIFSNTEIGRKIVKFLGKSRIDERRNDCLAMNDEFPDGTRYIYVNQQDEVKRQVSYNVYFDFLKESRYFDTKPHLQHRFSDILKETGANCLTDDTCENSLESMGKYDDYKDQLEEDRLYIIHLIIDILNTYGLNIEYNGYGSANFKNTAYNKQERSSYFWPIGSNETTEKGGILYADGSPAKTMKDVETYFGEWKNKITGEMEMHYGIDIKTDDGVTNIIAAQSGIVANIFNNCSKGDNYCNGGYGNVVYISHANGDYTVYAHLGEINGQIAVGNTVYRGEVIAKAGITGMTNTSNLHYEIRVGGNSVENAVDPIKNTPAGDKNPPSDDDLRPGIVSDFKDRSPKFAACKLTRDEFVSKINAFCSKGRVPSCATADLCGDDIVGRIYDFSQTVDLDPELIYIRAALEGYTPESWTSVSGSHNYWSIGNCNTCKGKGGHYADVFDGIRAFSEATSKYDTLWTWMYWYADLGRYWWNPGGSGVGGCYYYPHIKKYMSESRSSYIAGVCSPGDDKTCTTENTAHCVLKAEEDEHAYIDWQIEKIAEKFNSIFGVR